MGLVQLMPELDTRRVYDPPNLRKPTREQATLFLVGHAYIGHEGARELMQLLFWDPSDSK